jgi:CheY-like chemotaxis protein
MDRFPKLQELLNKALTQAVMDGGMLLGQELSVKESTFSSLEKQAYLKKVEDASFIVGVKSQEDYEGTFYLIFTIRDAIVLGSLLLGVPPARVSEKKKLAILEPDDVDAFNEFTNQVIGSFNSTFKPALPKKVHLKLLESKKFIPGEDTVDETEPLPDGEYFMFRSELGVPQQDMDKLDVLIPLPLASFYDLQENGAVEQEEIPAAIGGGAESKAGSGEKATVLILEDNSDDRGFFQETLSSADLNAMSAPLDADLNEFFSQGRITAVLLGATDLDDRELSICIKIRAFPAGGKVPVIMCANQWTRSDVLKALKYGASDIIIKPCSGDEVMGRLSKFLKAA